MKTLNSFMILIYLVMSFSTFAFAKAKPRSTNSNTNIKPITVKPEQKTNYTITQMPFRVQSVQFKLVPFNGKHYLAAAVVFNRNVDKSS